MASKEELQSQILNLVESEINFATFYESTEEQILAKDKNGIIINPIFAKQKQKLIQKVLVKKCIDMIQEAHSSSAFLKAIEKIAKHEKNNPNPNRGSTLFPQDRKVGQDLLILTLEFIIKTASMFSTDSNKNPTKFSQLYTRLQEEGVTFPQEPFMFFESKKKKKQPSQSISQQQQPNSNRDEDMGTKTATGNQKAQKNSSNVANKIIEDVQSSVSTLVQIFNTTHEIEQDIKNEIENQAKRFKKYEQQLTQMIESDGEFEEDLIMKMFSFQEFLNVFCAQVQEALKDKFSDNAANAFRDWLLRSELPFPLEGEDYPDQEQQMMQQQQQQKQQQQQQQSQMQPQQNQDSKKNVQDKQRVGSEIEEQKFDSQFQQNAPNKGSNINDPFNFNQFSSNQNPHQGNDEDLFGTFTNQQMKDLSKKNQGQQDFQSNFDEFNFGGSNVQNKQSDELAQQQKLQQEELDKQFKKQKEQERLQDEERQRLQQAEQLRREAEEKKKAKEQEDKLKKQKEEEEERRRRQQEEEEEEEKEEERMQKQKIQEQEQERNRLVAVAAAEEDNRKRQQRQQKEKEDEEKRLKQQYLEEQQAEYERLQQQQQYQQEDRKFQNTANDNQRSNFYFNQNDQYDRDSFGVPNKGYFYDSQQPNGQGNNSNTNKSAINNNNINNSINNNNNTAINNNNNNRPPAGPSQVQLKPNPNQDPKLSKIESAFGSSNQKFSFAPEQKSMGRNPNVLSIQQQNEDNRTEMSFNEQFSVSSKYLNYHIQLRSLIKIIFLFGYNNYMKTFDNFLNKDISAMGGGYAAHDFPLKHIKLMDNKVYKGVEIPLTNNIDQMLRSYNYSAQNMRRFRLSNLKRKNNLFENSQIQIGCISDLIFEYINAQNYLKLTIYLGNKTRLPIRNVKIEFDGDESSYVYMKTDKTIDFIAAKTQEKFEIIVGYKDIPISLVNMDVTADFGEIEESQSIECSIFMPNLLTKYIQFKDLDAYVFRTKWKELSAQIQRTDIFSVSKQIIKTPAYYRRYFTKILEITSLEQFVLQQSSNQYDVKYYKLGALIELHDTESEFFIKFNVRPDSTLCIQIISLNEAYVSTAANLLQHMRFLFQAS